MGRSGPCAYEWGATSSSRGSSFRCAPQGTIPRLDSHRVLLRRRAEQHIVVPGSSGVILPTLARPVQGQSCPRLPDRLESCDVLARGVPFDDRLRGLGRRRGRCHPDQGGMGTIGISRARILPALGCGSLTAMVGSSGSARRTITRTACMSTDSSCGSSRPALAGTGEDTSWVLASIRLPPVVLLGELASRREAGPVAEGLGAGGVESGSGQSGSWRIRARAERRRSATEEVIEGSPRPVEYSTNA